MDSLGALEKYEEAESYISKALKLAPVSPATWAGLGILHCWQGRNKEAYEDFSVAATYDPGSEYIRCKLAACSIALENYEEALNHYDECIKFNPNSYVAFTNKGNLLKHLWRIWDALDSYEQAIQIDSKKPYALYKSAFLLKDLGYNERAIQRYQLLLEKCPGISNIHLDLGMLYCRLGDLQTAAYHFHQADSYRNNSSSDNNSNKKVDFIDWSVPQTAEYYFRQAYLFKTKNLIEEKDKRKEWYLDMGYEVFYSITIELSKNSAHILSIESIPKLALFNAMPIMREYLNHAHLINQPLLGDPVLPPEEFLASYIP